MKGIAMTNETQGKPLYVSRTEVGKYFAGLNKKTLANLLSEGRGPKCFKNGRKVFYKLSDLESWLTQSPVLTVEDRP